MEDSTAPTSIQYLSHLPAIMPAASAKNPFPQFSGGTSMAPVAAMSGSRYPSEVMDTAETSALGSVLPGRSTSPAIVLTLSQ
uniref:Uncharacterized protein n=1 Tax=Arundo donax TaxID=35708 RepID=A0A0A9G0P4_ARUDO